MKIGVYVAHDDDAILGCGGRLVRHLNEGAEVYVVISADGRNSHKAVLNIENNPTPLEVMETRKREIKNAMKILGIEKLYFLETLDGKIKNNLEEVSQQITEISVREKPDIIYFHHYDAHPDHKAINMIVPDVFYKLNLKPKKYQFFIWTKELAKGRPEVDIEDVPEIPENIIRVDITHELEKKKDAIYEMKSQVLIHPYPDWQIQEKPILDKNFIAYFLRGEEIFVH